ncbi:MAG: hypothetical protein ACRELA_19270 [Candidatus Rokuibacteriota bacterium]
MATREARFCQAAWGYVGYGVVYWLGGLVLAAAGLGPRRMEGAATHEGLVVVMLFTVGALLVVLIPWLLMRERGWFNRWILSRRDFARILTVFVAYRAWEVSRIARAPRVELVQVAGFAFPVRIGAWAFFAMTVVMVILLARAAWSREA